jgi:hypothetical protein
MTATARQAAGDAGTIATEIRTVFLDLVLTKAWSLSFSRSTDLGPGKRACGY